MSVLKAKVKIMTADQLREICLMEGISIDKNARKDTLVEAVFLFMEENGMTVSQVKKNLEDRGEPFSEITLKKLEDFDRGIRENTSVEENSTDREAFAEKPTEPRAQNSQDVRKQAPAQNSALTLEELLAKLSPDEAHLICSEMRKATDEKAFLLNNKVRVEVQAEKTGY